jgi:hypothetical protein
LQKLVSVEILQMAAKTPENRMQSRASLTPQQSGAATTECGHDIFKTAPAVFLIDSGTRVGGV